MTNEHEEKIQAEMDNAKDMKISELKMKLMAKGVLTTTFLEKEEFVRAYVELIVKDGKNSGVDGLLQKDVSTENNDGDDDDDDQPITDGLPTYMKLRVEKLVKIHEEREVLMEQYLKDRAEIEKKYETLSQPFFEKRTNIISGAMDNEIATETTADDELLTASDNVPDDQQDNGIPHFWSCAIHQMPVTADLIKEQDLECLESLMDVRCINYENGKGFILEFVFGENDCFDNKVLYKSYDVPNLLLADEPILKNVEGTDIKWKPNKNLTVAQVYKQQRGKGKNAGQNRMITKEVERDSFFNFFTPPKMPSLQTANEEEVMSVEVAFNDDYDIAQAFRSHIIPKAVLWFSGDALEQEMNAAMEGMEWPPEGSS